MRHRSGEIQAGLANSLVTTVQRLPSKSHFSGCDWLAFGKHPQSFATLVNIAMHLVVREKQNSHQALCFIRPATMTTLNVIDPHHMTMQERREEVASILALGLIRLRTDTPPPVAVEKKKELGFSPAQRVHTNPASRVRMEIRETLLAQKKGV